MRSIHRSAIAIVAAALLGAPQAGASNLLFNGSFELGSNLAAGQAMVVPSGGGAINGWSVGANGVLYCDGAYWEPLDGSRTIGLNTASGPGTIGQSFATYPGAHYRALFFLAGDPTGAPAIKHLRVSAAGTSSDYTFDTTSLWPWHMAWDVFYFSFTANSNPTLLEFTSLDAGSAGPAIDSVRVDLLDPLDVTGALERPISLSLSGPNPGAGPTAIEYSLPRDTDIRLGVFDLQGREIARIASGPTPAGPHLLRWDGLAAGRPAPAGVYLIQLHTPERSLTRR